MRPHTPALVTAVALVTAAVALVAGCAKPTAPGTAPRPSTPASAPTAQPATGPLTWSVEKAWDGLEQPIGLTSARDGTGRVFIIEKPGRIRLIKGGKLISKPFLDVSDRVSTGSEQGLLGLAFPPGSASKDHFYIDYTDRNGDTRIARVRVSGDPDVADPGSVQTVLSIAQPYANHNGGQLAFGPDGYLYIGMGDGGKAGDPDNRAQDPSKLLGKLLRIDTEGGADKYSVPPTNPYATDPGWRGEIWAFGLRNPWRFSFDRETGDLWIGDVGQNAWEEIDFQSAASRGGQNYGWPRWEADHLYDASRKLTTRSVVKPVAEYSHSVGVSVTGGYVYRGKADPAMRGWYCYGDYVSGTVWGIKRDGLGWTKETLLQSGAAITSFGEDEDGEIYLCDHNGSVLRLRGRPQVP